MTTRCGASRCAPLLTSGAHVISIVRQVRNSVLVALGGGRLLLILAPAGHESPAAIPTGVSFRHFRLGVLMAADCVGLLDAVPNDNHGSACALAGSARVAAAGLAGFLIDACHDGSALSVAATIASLCVRGAMGRMIAGPATHRGGGS